MLVLTAPSVGATIIDFTADAWSGVQRESSFTLGNVQLESTGFMTFNAGGDASGCLSGNQSTGLVCDGDGIGIYDDEITHRSNESLRVTFLGGPVDITDIHLLDLFAGEETGEIAVINGIESQATIQGISIMNDGGYWETGLGFIGIDSLIFTGMVDSFSDYSLARIDYETTAVPEPTMLSMLGIGLIGLGAAYRRRRLNS